MWCRQYLQQRLRLLQRECAQMLLLCVFVVYYVLIKRIICNISTTTTTTSGAVAVACNGLTESILREYDTPTTVDWLAKIGITGDTLKKLRDDEVTGEVLLFSNDGEITDMFPSAIARKKIVLALQFVKANK